MYAACKDFICLNNSQRQTTKISEIFYEIFTHLIGLTTHLDNKTPFTIQGFP